MYLARKGETDFTKVFLGQLHRGLPLWKLKDWLEVALF